MIASSAASLRVFTFKEGMLARLGHDLRLSATRFEVRAGHGAVKASVDLSSLTVDGACKNGALDPHALNDSDREKILGHVQRDVLEVARQRDAVFEAQTAQTGSLVVLRGTLSLHGRSRALEAQVTQDGAQLTVSAEFSPSDWGIAPFRALAGAIRVQDRVRIELRVSLASGIDPGALGDSSLSFRCE